MYEENLWNNPFLGRVGLATSMKLKPFNFPVPLYANVFSFFSLYGYSGHSLSTQDEVRRNKSLSSSWVLWMCKEVSDGDEEVGGGVVVEDNAAGSGYGTYKWDAYGNSQCINVQIKKASLL